MLYSLLAIIIFPAIISTFTSHAPAPDNEDFNGDGDGKFCIQADGIRAHFIPYGASLTNLFVNDTHGIERDLVLGFENASFYSQTPWHPHLNSIPGRYANRIRNGSFVVDGREYHTDLNDHGVATLHGGGNGWDYRNWTLVSHNATSVTFNLTDEDGEMGFPGQVDATVTYAVEPYTWLFTMRATGFTKKTPVMLSSHTYLNLDGFANPETPLARGHELYTPYAKRRVETDGILIPTGKILEVAEGDAYDFWSKPKALGEDVEKAECGGGCAGYDVCFPFARSSDGNWTEEAVATLRSAWSGIAMEVFTDQAALQVYSCNNMNGTFPLKATQGLHGDPGRPRVVEKYGCVVLEVEDWIDGINHPEWGRKGRQVLGPGEEYLLQGRYRFSVDS